MNGLNESILKAVAYFDMFCYPVTPEEIRHFMDGLCDEKTLEGALKELVNEKLLCKSEGYYSFHKDNRLAIKRIKENNAARKQLKIARRIGIFLSWFPFTRGVAISGSLSKNVAHKGSDFDFFIITKENRLWLNKFFYSLVIRCAAVVGLKKWFCLNYFIDETCLEVQEKNVFTATEILTLMPLRGDPKVFEKFFIANNWVHGFCPNHPAKVFTGKASLLLFPGNLIEWLLKTQYGEKADNALMRYFDKRWEKLLSRHWFTESGFQLGAMMVDKHFCRPYPEHFQQRILERYKKKIETLKTDLRVSVLD